MAYTILAGGASKALTVEQFFDYLQELQDPGDLRNLYKWVSWHYRCIQLRANAVASIPYDIYKADADPETAQPVSDEVWGIDLENLLWEAEAWLSLYGAGYWLKGQNRLAKREKTITALQVLNSYTMEEITDKDHPEKGIIRFEQTVNGEIKPFKPEQIVYFRRWSPETDTGPGVSPAMAGSVPGELVRNLNLWAKAFFENGAVPLTLLYSEGMVPDPERERIETFWNRLTKGVDKAFKTLVLRRGLEPKVITPPLKDLAMPDLSEEERYQIASGYGVPLSMLGAKNVNRATAEIDEIKWWTENMVPEVKHKIKPTLNDQLFNPLGLQIAFHPKEIEALQKSEIQKAESMSFTISGIVIPAYDANLMSVDESRKVINAVLESAALPGLSDSFEPEERMPAPAPAGGENPEAPGGGAQPGENVQNRAAPKALAPEWGRLMISSQSLPDGGIKQQNGASP